MDTTARHCVFPLSTDAELIKYLCHFFVFYLISVNVNSILSTILWTKWDFFLHFFNYFFFFSLSLRVNINECHHESKGSSGNQWKVHSWGTGPSGLLSCGSGSYISVTVWKEMGPELMLSGTSCCLGQNYWYINTVTLNLWLFSEIIETCLI